jgi:hypothetical protein
MIILVFSSILIKLHMIDEVNILQDNLINHLTRLVYVHHLL